MTYNNSSNELKLYMYMYYFKRGPNADSITEK